MVNLCTYVYVHRPYNTNNNNNAYYFITQVSFAIKKINKNITILWILCFNLISFRLRIKFTSLPHKSYARWLNKRNLSMAEACHNLRRVRKLASGKQLHNSLFYYARCLTNYSNLNSTSWTAWSEKERAQTRARSARCE